MYVCVYIYYLFFLFIYEMTLVQYNPNILLTVFLNFLNFSNIFFSLPDDCCL